MKFSEQLSVLGYKSYQEYLSSAHWREIRKRYWASKLNPNKWCAGCRRKDVPLQLHHRTYKRIGNERLTDLVAVCGTCHLAIHAREKRQRDKGKSSNLWGVTSGTLRKKDAKARKRRKIAAKQTAKRKTWERHELERARELMRRI